MAEDSSCLTPERTSSCVEYVETEGVLYIHLYEDATSAILDSLISEINQLDKKFKNKIIVIVHQNLEFLSGIVIDKTEKKIYLENGNRVAISDSNPSFNTRRKRLMEVFTGDYLVRFFESNDKALTWMKETD